MLKKNLGDVADTFAQVFMIAVMVFCVSIVLIILFTNAPVVGLILVSVFIILWIIAWIMT